MKAHALLKFYPAQTMIADLCFVFQKCTLAIAKRATEEAQEASAAMTCSMKGSQVKKKYS
jgi:hypothetical protein